jgi:CrcB protein
MLGWPGYLLVFLGAGLGGTARYSVNLATARLPGLASFSGNVGVNVLGSLLIGLLAAYLGKAGAEGDTLRLLLATGVLGGFTTFSAFSLDAVSLWQRGAPTAAVTYVLASVVLSLVAAFLGLGAGARLFA